MHTALGSEGAKPRDHLEALQRWLASASAPSPTSTTAAASAAPTATSASASASAAPVSVSHAALDPVALTQQSKGRAFSRRATDDLNVASGEFFAREVAAIVGHLQAVFEEDFVSADAPGSDGARGSGGGDSARAGNCVAVLEDGDDAPGSNSSSDIIGSREWWRQAAVVVASAPTTVTSSAEL